MKNRFAKRILAFSTSAYLAFAGCSPLKDEGRALQMIIMLQEFQSFLTA